MASGTQTPPSGSSFDPTIIGKARKAYHLAASKHQIAHKQIRELCDDHSDNPLLFLTQAQILEKCSDEATDMDKKSRLMENAILCAQKAITLSPNSMDFNSFLGYLFYKRSVEPGDYKKAIEQLNTALNIPRPTDPAQETLLTDEEIQSRFPTYEARIDDSRKCILKHIGECLLKLDELKAYSSIEECLQIVKVKNKEEEVRIAWYILGLSERGRPFQLNIDAMKSHLISSKDQYDIFLQALSFFECHRKWQFWMCCICEYKFTTAALYLNHVVKDHLRELLTEFRNAFSVKIIDWIHFIDKIKWKPLDTCSVITTFEKNMQSLSSIPEFSSSTGEVQSLEKTVGEKLLEERSLFNQESLISDDSNRATLLSKIQDKLEDFVCSDWFMAFHLDMMIQRAMKLLHGFLGDCLTVFHLEHYCLCLLDVSQLEGILRFLDEMSNFTSKAFGKKNSNIDILRARFQGTQIEGEISVDIDSLYVSLDEYPLTSGSLSKKISNNKHRSPITAEDWILWICSGPSSDEHLKEWRNLKDQKTSHVKEELIKFENCLSESLKNLHEFQEEQAVDVTPTDVSAPEVDKEMLDADVTPTPTDAFVLEVEKEIGFSPQKPEADTSIQSMIHEKRENNDSVLNKSERRILEVAVDIQQLEAILSCVPVYSYQPILLSILKSYIRELLEAIVPNISIKKYDAAPGMIQLQVKLVDINNKDLYQIPLIKEDIKDLWGLEDFIANKLSIPRWEQIIVRDSTKGPVRLNYEDPLPQDMICVYQNSMQDRFVTVHVRLPDKELHIEISSASTVEDLKMEIERRAEIPPHLQQLTALGWELCDTSFISDHMITWNFPVFDCTCRIRVKVIVLVGYHSHLLELEPLDTVQQLAYMALSKGMVQGKLRFHFEHKWQTLNKDKSLSEYGISDGSVVLLVEELPARRLQRSSSSPFLRG